MEFNYPKIEKAIKENKLVFFVGSGLSMPLNLPNWEGLVKRIASDLHKNNPQDFQIKAIIDSVEQNFEPLKILDAIDKKYHFDSLRAVSESINEISIADPILQKKIFQISDQIITTNYDTAFEIARDQLKKFHIHKMVYSDIADIVNLEYNNSYIFKLHGCITDPPNCILFKDQYKGLYNFKNGAIYKLFSILDDSTIIFIGFSLNDPYFRQLLELRKKIYKGSQKGHFIVTASDVKWDHYGIQAIKLKNYTSDLNHFLQYLIDIRTECPLMLSQYYNSLKRIGIAVDESKAKRDFNLLTEFSKQINYDYDTDFDINSIEKSNELIADMLATLYTELRYCSNSDSKGTTMSEDKMKVKIADLHFKSHLVYKLHVKFQNAKEHLNKAIAISEGSDKLYYKMTLAAFYLDTDEFKESLRLYQELLKLKIDDSKRLEILNGLGLAYRRNSQLQDALTVLKQCNAIAQKSTVDVLESATAKVNYAMALLEISRYEDAHQVLNTFDVKAVFKKYEETKNLVYILLLQTYNVASADLFRTLGHYKRALENIEAVTLSAICFKVASLETNHIYTTLADIKYEQNEFEEALKIYTDQLKYYSEVVGETHHLTLNIHFGISRCLQKLGKEKKAQKMLFDLVSSYKLNLGDYHKQTAKCHGEIGHFFKRAKQFGKALQSYDKALKIFHLDAENNTQNLIVTYVNLAETAHQMNDQSSINYMTSALKLYETNPHLKDIYYFQHNFDLAFYYQYVPMFDLAFETVQKTLSEMQFYHLIDEKNKQLLLLEMEKKWKSAALRIDIREPIRKSIFRDKS